MSASPLTAKRFLISLIIGWVVLVNVQAFFLRNYFELPLYIVITDSLVSNFLLLLAGLLMLNVTKYYLPSSYQYSSVIASCLIMTGLWLFISNTFLKIFLDDSEAYLSFLNRSLVIRAVVAFLVLTILTIAAILWYNWVERQKVEQRRTDADRLSREAELFKLRQQLQPHFLFNSLNSINALIGLNPQQARKMVQQLSDFLRGTLKKEESQMISLTEEINYLNLYLEIEKVRFGNRLMTSIVIPEETKDLLLPTLLLQPVVENAIKFGLYDTIGETLITIESTREQNELCIVVTNPFDPETSLPKTGTGFGLSSIKRRLYLLYGRNDLLSTKTQDNIYYTIVKIPQQA
ncbi:sensor histidine kinase [Niabella drilacis]|uniref:Histidine kinase n=1 Tax=Niabella drilacis (strain DSM 25811 / CCM 8410 / CCUG 62505 / LMG 26954 / E90) TaxID=1285928 RepID=A0A1G6VR53_NIADE|nr:histidine kinase [Niabella drilacis]SDD56011.1 Histidine kinase [Niabella drilacis]